VAFLQRPTVSIQSRFDSAGDRWADLAAVHLLSSTGSAVRRHEPAPDFLIPVLVAWMKTDRAQSNQQALPGGTAYTTG
jgi:hypothetical protein